MDRYDDDDDDDSQSGAYALGGKRRSSPDANDVSRRHCMFHHHIERLGGSDHVYIHTPWMRGCRAPSALA